MNLERFTTCLLFTIAKLSTVCLQKQNTLPLP